MTSFINSNIYKEPHLDTRIYFFLLSIRPKPIENFIQSPLEYYILWYWDPDDEIMYAHTHLLCSLYKQMINIQAT